MNMCDIDKLAILTGAGFFAIGMILIIAGCIIDMILHPHYGLRK